MRFLPIRTGFEVFAAWMDGLPPIGPSLDLPSTTGERRRLRARSLKSATARKLFVRIYSAPKRTQGDLAQESGLSQPVASRIVARLEKGGLIQARRCGREVRYTVDPEGLQRLHKWSSGSLRSLTAGRVVAEAQDLSDQRLTAEAPDRVAVEASAAALPLPAYKAPSPVAPPAQDSTAISGAASGGGAGAMQGQVTLPNAEPPRSALNPTRPFPTLPRPQQAGRKIPHTLKPEDIRPGDCFRDKSGGEIRVLSLCYGELSYLYRSRGRQIAEKRSPRYPLAATLVEAVAWVGF